MNLKVVSDTEPISASDTRRLVLTLFTVVVSLLAIVAMTLLLTSGGRVAHLDPWAVGVLTVLTIIGTHGEEVFGDETAINGSMLVVLAGAGIAYAGGPLWVAGVCGLVAGLHWHHVRDRAKRKLLLNTCFTTLSVLAAVEVARALTGDSPGLVVLAAIGVAAATAYWLTDNVLVAIVLAIAYGRPVRAHARELLRSETEIIPFAVLGFLNGYAFIRLGPWIGVLGSVLLLVLTEGLIFRHGRDGSLRRFGKGVLLSVLIVVPGALILTGGVGPIHHVVPLVLAAVISLVGATALDRFRSPFALCALIACVVAAVVALPDDRPATVAIVVGAAACLGMSIRTRRISTRFKLVGAAAVATLALGGVFVLFQLSAYASPITLVLAGTLGALVALLAWHLVLAFALALQLGGGLLLSSFAIMRGEVGVALAAGLAGAASGWIGLREGAAGLVISLAVVVAMSALGARRTTRRGSPGHPPPLDDNQLRDVLQSAVLDLPASRLPD